MALFVPMNRLETTMFIQSLYQVHPLIHLSPVEADLKGWSGAVSLDLELLDQHSVSAVTTDSIEGAGVQDQVWLQYAHSKRHPVLQYLYTKLAEWISEICRTSLDFLISRTLPIGNILQGRVVPDRNGC